MLEAHDVHKVYRTGRVDLPVLQGVSVRVEPGEFLAITGPSGAGKSTLLHVLAGLDTPTAGEVRWEGRSLSDMTDGERARFRNRTIGVVFQFYHLLSELSALENVMLPGLVGGQQSAKAVRQRASSCLRQVGLGARLGHKPGALSGGERQRAAIARALVNEPRLIFCDEPTGNLDSAAGAGVAQLMVELHRRSGVGIVLVTHDAQLAQIAQRQLMLRDGRVVEERLPHAAGRSRHGRGGG